MIRSALAHVLIVGPMLVGLGAMPVLAQTDDELDRLYLAVESAKAKGPDSAVVNRYLYAAHVLRNRPKESIAYADSAQQLAERIGYAEGMLLADSRRIFPLALLGQHLTAISTARKVLPRLDVDREPLEYMRALNAFGIVLTQLGATRDAREQYLEQLRVARQVGDSARVQVAIANISTSYFYDGDYAESLRWLRQSYEMNRKSRLSSMQVDLVNLGETYLVLKDYDRAVEYLTQALAEARYQQDERIIASALGHLGELALAQGNRPVAQRYAEQSYSMADRLGIRRQRRDAARTMARSYAQAGDYAQAYAWQSIHRTLNDSLKPLSGRARYAELLVALEMQRSEQELVRLERGRNQQRLLQLSLAMLLVVAGAFGWVTYRGLGQAQRSRQSIQATSQQLLEANEELRQALHALDRESAELERSIAEFDQSNARLITANAQAEADAIEVNASLALAQRIQQALLPRPEVLDRAFLQHFILYQPRELVSGDMYWCQQVGSKHVFAAVDCTGHGVPGAFMTMIAHSLLSQIVVDRGVIDPGAILAELHKGIRRALKQDRNDSRDGLDIALCVIDPSQKSLGYAGANLPLAYLHRGQLAELKPDKYAVGGVQHELVRTYAKSYLLYDPDYTFYLFSDGVYHQFGGEQRRKLSIGRFYQLLQQTHHEALAEQRPALMRELKTWQGSMRQLDDWMVIGFRLP